MSSLGLRGWQVLGELAWAPSLFTDTLKHGPDATVGPRTLGAVWQARPQGTGESSLPIGAPAWHPWQPFPFPGK